MNKFKTDDNGGLPFVLDDNRWQDDGYRLAFKGILSSYGVDDSQTILLSGCERSVSSGVVTISEGYVSIGGEVCFVPEHTFSNVGLSNPEYWVIETTFETTGTKQFQDASTHETYEVRVGKVKTSASIPSGFTAYQDTQTIYDVINSKVDVVPVGVIVMWSGSIADIPTGYALCDGNDVTPDLRGRFVLGVDPRTTNPSNGIWDSNYNSIGNVGGEKNHKLTVQEMPSHQHAINIATATTAPDLDALVIPNATEGQHSYDPIDVSGSTGSNGGNEPHNNIPPYYVLAFIMKVSTIVPISPSNPSTALSN